jgi:hypothetical protein
MTNTIKNHDIVLLNRCCNVSDTGVILSMREELEEVWDRGETGDGEFRVMSSNSGSPPKQL